MNVSKLNLLARFSVDKYNRIPISDSEGLIRLLCFEPNQGVSLHKHPSADEFFYVAEGNGRIRVGDEEIEVDKGSIVKASATIPHEWKNGAGRMVLISVLIPLPSYELSDKAVKMEFV